MSGTMRSIRGSIVVALFIVLVPAAGCVEKDTTPTAPVNPGTTVRLLEPAPGDTVSGRVKITAWLGGTKPVRGLIFLVDGAPFDTLEVFPWETSWLSAVPPEGAEVRFHVEAWLDDAISIRSEESAVWVLHARPPQVTIQLPDRALWLEKNGEGELSATACDAEDGRIPSDQLHWTGERLFRDLPGASLPVVLLPEGRQRVTAVAENGDGTQGRRSIEVTVFAYRGAGTPEDALHDLACGLRAMDARAVTPMLDTEFRFETAGCCTSGTIAGPIWNRERFGEQLDDWMEDPHNRELTWVWESSRPAIWERDGRRFAWFRCTDLDIGYRSGRVFDPENCQIDPGGERLSRSSGGTVGLLLVEDPDGSWKLRRWVECSVETGTPFSQMLSSPP